MARTEEGRSNLYFSLLAGPHRALGWSAQLPRSILGNASATFPGGCEQNRAKTNGSWNKKPNPELVSS